MKITTETIKFFVGEIILLICSVYAGVFGVFPYVVDFMPTENAYDIFTPMIIGVPISIIVVLTPLTFVWHRVVFKKMVT